MSKNKYILTILCICFFSHMFSQKGKNSVRTVSTTVRVNEFTALTADANKGSTILNVTANTLNANSRFGSVLAAGDLVMVIQMQGAMMNLGTYPVSWQPDSTYGYIWNYANCGNYEFAQVKSVISGTQIELDCELTYSYSATGKTQVVRVPRYTDLTVTAAGVLTTDAWNGTIGGVLAVEVDGNTIIDGNISANGLGFRGGAAVGNGGSGNSNFVTRNPNDGAEKGEGIGSNRLNNTLAIDSLGKQCKGAPANGGGGGNANNCGGGGGGNGGDISNWKGYGLANTTYSVPFNLEFAGRAFITSSGGGKGGYGTSTNNSTNPNSVGPNNASWGSFRRPSYGGFGGRPLDYSTGKLFMGGGGGAGHMSSSQSNGANASSGGAGGGLIYILNYGTISGSGSINANGANGNNAFGSSIVSPQGIDGAGGAGAGGTIILQSNGVVSGITANANGGRGGNQAITGVTSEGQGPGGGGSGGYISATNTGFTQNVNGGANGTTNAAAFDTEFPMNGATSGDVGTKDQIISPSFSLTASSNQTICTNQSANVTATSTNPTVTIQWYNTAAGGSAVSTGTAYTTPVYSSAGTYTVFAGSCPGLYRLPIVITVNNGANLSVNSPSICSGQSVILTASGATTFTWSSGPTTNTISVTPTVTTVYTVSGSSASCNSTQTATVTVNSIPSLTVTDVSICSGSTATLTASGATNYTWNPGSQTSSSITVTPSSSVVYTITGANGSCSATATSSLNVTTTPTLTPFATTICTGQTATLSANGAATYTWLPGNSNNTTYTISPASSTTVTLIGANGNCVTQLTNSITIGSAVSIAVTGATVCAGQTGILTASGVSTYTWSNGLNTNTIAVSPTVTTTYTVDGTNGSCSGTNTVAITVINQPTLSVTGNMTICSGNSTTLTANGASSYTWSPIGVFTTSVTVNPNSTTDYTITGSNGVCSTTTTASVNVTSTPTLLVNSVAICSGQTASLTVSGASTFTWTPGNVSGSNYTLTPSASTVVSVIGANGTCTSSATASITVGSGISPTANTATICSGQTATLTANGANTYTWSTGSNNSSINVNPITTTVYSFTGAIGSCDGVSSTTVFVNAAPTLTVNATDICAGQTATLTVSGANTYTWSNGINGSSQTVSPVITTTYTVNGTDANGCINTLTASAVVNVATTPTININTASVCSGQTATLTASGATSFTWSTSETTATINPAPINTSTYFVVGSNGGCVSSATTLVTVDNTSLTTNSFTFSTCPSQTVALFGTGSNSTTTTYTWSNGVNTYSQTVAPVNTTTYVVNGTSLSGCPALSGTVIVNVNSISASYSGITGSIMTIGEILNLNNTSTGQTSIIWDYCDGLSTDEQLTIPITDTGSCCIKLTAINSACRDSVTNCVKYVNPTTVSIPNVFTPNGDGKNEVFKVKSTGLKTLNCIIYDRWGLKMYEWDGVNGFWDGSAKSGSAPDGTYFYIINYTDQKDKSTAEKGYLNLFRD